MLESASLSSTNCSYQHINESGTGRNRKHMVPAHPTYNVSLEQMMTEQVAPAKAQDAETPGTSPAVHPSCATALASCSSSSQYIQLMAVLGLPPGQISDVTCSSNSCVVKSSTSCSTFSISATAAVAPTAAAAGTAALHSCLGMVGLEQTMEGTFDQLQATATRVPDAEETETRSTPNSNRDIASLSCSSSSLDHASLKSATQHSNVTRRSGISPLRSEATSTHPAVDGNTDTAPASCSSGAPGYANREPGRQTSDVTCSSIGTPSGCYISTQPTVDSRGDISAASCSRSPSHYGPRPPACSSNITTASTDVSGRTVSRTISRATAAAVSVAAPAALPSSQGLPVLEQLTAGTTEQQQDTASEIQYVEEAGTFSAADSGCAPAPAHCSSSAPGDGSPLCATQITDVACNRSINTPRGDTTDAHLAADSSRDTTPAPMIESAKSITDVLCSSSTSSMTGGPVCKTVNSSSATAAVIPALMVAKPPAPHSYSTKGLKQYRFYSDPVCSQCGDTGHVAEECSTCYCSLCCCHGHPTGCCSAACSNCGKVHAEPRGTSCSICKCAFCHLWGHVAATCPSARCNRCGYYGHISKERCRALATASRYNLAEAAAPTSISPGDLIAASAAAAAGSRSDLTPAAPAAVSIHPRDLSPSQIKLQRPTDSSDPRKWRRQLLRTLRAAAPAYVAAAAPTVGPQPDKLACLSRVTPDDLAVIMQLDHPTEFLDQVYQHYCATACGRSSTSPLLTQQQDTASSTAGPAPFPAQPIWVPPPAAHQPTAAPASSSPSGLTAAAASSSNAPDLAAAVPAAESTYPPHLSPSQIRPQKPSNARRRRQLLRSLQVAVPAYAAAVGLQPDKLAWLSRVSSHDLAAIMQLDHPDDFLDRVYYHFCDTTFGIRSSGSSVDVRRQQKLASTTLPLPAQPTCTAPLSGYQPAADEATALAPPAPVTTGSYYAPGSVPMLCAAPFNYQPAAYGTTALPSLAQVSVPMGSCYVPSPALMLPAVPSNQIAADYFTALPPPMPVPVDIGSYYTSAPVPVLPIAPVPVPACQVIVPGASWVSPLIDYNALAPQFAEHLAPQFAPQLAPQFAPQLAPQFAPQLAPQFAPPLGSQFAAMFVPQVCLPWPEQSMHPAAAAPVWPPPSTAAAAWQQQQSRQGHHMGINRRSTSSVGSSCKQISRQPAASADADAVAASHELITTAGSSKSSSMPRRLRGRSAGVRPQVQCLVCGCLGHIAGDCKACRRCKQHGHTIEDCAMCPAVVAARDVTAATAAAASEVAFLQLPQPAAAAAATCPLPAAATAISAVVASWQLPRPAAAAAAALSPLPASANSLPLLELAPSQLPQTAAAAIVAIAAAPMTTAAAAAAEEVRNVAVAALAEPAAEASEAATTAPPPPLQLPTHRARNVLKHAYDRTEYGRPQREGHEYGGQLVEPTGSSCHDAHVQLVQVRTAAAAAAAAVDLQVTTAASPAITPSQPSLQAATAPCQAPAAATTGRPLLLCLPSLSPPPPAAAIAAASATILATEPPLPGRLLLSAADIDSILAPNDPRDMLDANYEKHSQQQRGNQSKRDQESVSKPGCDGDHVQQQQHSASNAWQQPLLEPPTDNAVQQIDTTITYSTAFQCKERSQDLGASDIWALPQQQHTDLSHEQDSMVQQQDQSPKLDLPCGTPDCPKSAIVNGYLYFDSSSDSEDLDLLLVKPAVAAQAQLQEATAQVELVTSVSEVHVVGQYTIPEQEIARSNNDRGDIGLEASHEADVQSDDSEISDMLTILIRH